MKLINAMHKPDLPGKILFQPAGALTLPSSTEVSDSQSVNGSGVGGGSNSIKTALGEYFERRHFYREIISDRRGCLNETLVTHEVCSFVKAFAQTSVKEISADEIEQYKFALSEVVRASDFSRCLIPTVCISLSSHGLGEDSFVYPLRDTCGCSFHWCSDNALLGALKEYLERQFLIKFWLTKRCCSRMTSSHVEALLKDRHVRYLYNALAASGEVTLLAISDTRFPGVCILAVYGKNIDGCHVKYCAGMSYSSNLVVAAEKSLLELWQTFRFMDLFRATDSEEAKIEDSYIRYFLSCNSYEVYQEVVDVLECGGRGTSPRNFTVAGFLTVLKKLKITGYFYSKRKVVNGVGCTFVKFVSPDLFLHMNNSKSFNLKNKYSSGFELSILRSRLERMVPFP